MDKLLVEYRLSCGDMSPEVLAQTVEHAKEQAQTNRVVKVWEGGRGSWIFHVSKRFCFMRVHLLQELMYPLFLYDNYLAFQQAMIEQNIQLQMLALDDIQKRTGSLPLYIKDQQFLENGQLVFPEDRGKPPVTDDQLLEIALKYVPSISLKKTYS